MAFLVRRLVCRSVYLMVSATALLLLSSTALAQCGNLDACGAPPNRQLNEAYFGGALAAEAGMSPVSCSLSISVPAGRQRAYLPWYLSYWALASPTYCATHDCDLHFRVTVLDGIYDEIRLGRHGSEPVNR